MGLFDLLSLFNFFCFLFIVGILMFFNPSRLFMDFLDFLLYSLGLFMIHLCLFMSGLLLLLNRSFLLLLYILLLLGLFFVLLNNLFWFLLNMLFLLLMNNLFLFFKDRLLLLCLYSLIIIFQLSLLLYLGFRYQLCQLISNFIVDLLELGLDYLLCRF